MKAALEGRGEMRNDLYSVVRWGALWRSRDGEHIIFENCIPALFTTRKQAREYIEQKYGYIRKREDLRIAPHWWRMPIAVRMTITLC